VCLKTPAYIVRDKDFFKICFVINILIKVLLLGKAARLINFKKQNKKFNSFICVIYLCLVTFNVPFLKS
jgi:hypothetical protein